MLSIALTDINFSHNLVYGLLSNYFIEDGQFLEVNLKIEKLIKTTIVLSKARFEIEYFIKSLSMVGLKAPMTELRKGFKIYYPVVRQAERERVEALKKLKLNDDRWCEEMYSSSLNFWSDMIEIAKVVDHSKPKEFKKEWIVDKLHKMNSCLPSFVFIPSSSICSFDFFLEALTRCMMIVRIEEEETRIFQTKTKTNFALCFQLVKPEEYLMRNTYVLRENHEKRIKTKCKKILQKELTELLNKNSKRDRNSVRKTLKLKLVDEPLDRRTDNFGRSKQQSFNREVNSMFYGDFSLLKNSDVKDPLLGNGGFKEDGVNISSLLNSTDKFKNLSNEDATILSMIKQEGTAKGSEKPQTIDLNIKEISRVETSQMYFPL